MIKKRRKNGGWLSAEMVAAVALMAILIGVLASLGSAFKKVNDRRWLQQTLAAAGQAQMDAIATTGKQIDAERFGRLWPKVTCQIDISEGAGQWAGLQQVQLHLTTEKRGKTVESHLVQYVLIREER